MFNWLKIRPSAKQEPKTFGQIGEELAQTEYKKRGYKILAANFFNRKGKQLGEIDFIACDRKTIIFVEVKTRAEESGFHGTPIEAVDYFKQIKLLKAVKVFLLKQPKYQKFKPQIDVAAIILKSQDGLMLVETNPSKYLVTGKLDKLSYSVTIIPNAVEDCS
jgi:putative endonuclease